MSITKSNVYCIFDRGAQEVLTLFVAKNDFTAIQMNLHALEDPNNKINRSQFTLIRLGELSDDLTIAEDKKVICRLCDIEAEFDRALSALDSNI